MKAVILAGGKGTRLAQQTKDIPKPMLILGGKPILEHQVLLLKKYGINDIIILINYLGNVIKEYFNDGEKFGVNIEYYEEKEPLGTVGGLVEVKEKLKDDFIVFYGDVMINMDLNRLINFHREKKSECSLVIHPNNHPYDSDLVETNNNSKIINILPKDQPRDIYYKNLVNAGAYIFSPAIFKFLEKGKKADFGRDVFPKIYKEIKMFGYNTAEYLKDMGTPERLAEVEKDLVSGKIERMNYEHKRSAIFLDRDGVMNHEISFIHKPEQLQLFDFTADAIKKINHSEFLSIVITNQSVIARNLCTIEELETIHKKMETNLGKERAKLDAIYYCPHHPDKGYPEERPEYKIECECRKPKIGMFRQAAQDFNIDLSSSYMIGDSERDILAGYNAGCITIGVREGYGVKETKMLPDYMFTNLKEAVDFIIDEPFKEVLNQVKTKITNSVKHPYIIAIGGNTRSGKSTLTSYLRNNLEKEYTVLHIEFDNWLLPEKIRKNTTNVFNRFQLNKIEKDIEMLIKGNTISLTKYKNLENQPDEFIEYNLQKIQVVIIDGVVALSSKILRNLSDMKLFITTSEKERLTRIKEYYLWRGKDEDYIIQLLKDRKDDEYNLIEKDIKFADIVINN